MNLHFKGAIKLAAVAIVGTLAAHAVITTLRDEPAPVPVPPSALGIDWTVAPCDAPGSNCRTNVAPATEWNVAPRGVVVSVDDHYVRAELSERQVDEIVRRVAAECRR